jgi:energy-coupling factor transporter ATP-binding protein EcfA2
MSGRAAIRTEGLTKDYGGGNGLFDLDLEIERGEVFGFLGPNGAGKSTTMRLLLDLITPTRGSASLLDLDSHADSLAIRRRVGHLPGDFELYPKLTGTVVLDYLAELRGGVDRKIRDGLAERFDAPPDREWSRHRRPRGARRGDGAVDRRRGDPGSRPRPARLTVAQRSQPVASAYISEPGVSRPSPVSSRVFSPARIIGQPP